MTKLKFSFLTLLMLFCTLQIRAQVKYNVANDKDKTSVDITFYGGLMHQHHDFYSKAFSFQGIELGAILYHNFILGAYASTFVSILDVKIGTTPMYLQMWQSGAVFGVMMNSSKFASEGFLLNTGYVSIVGDDSTFSLFKKVNPQVKTGGLVLTPQFCVEMNFLKWMKCRIGIAYNLYLFRNQSLINKADLQNFSLNFGFLFGNFGKTNSNIGL